MKNNYDEPFVVSCLSVTITSAKDLESEKWTFYFYDPIQLQGLRSSHSLCGLLEDFLDLIPEVILELPILGVNTKTKLKGSKNTYRTGLYQKSQRI